MINQLSNRVFAWLAGTLMGMIILLALFLRFAEEIRSAGLFLVCGLALFATLLIAFALYSLWHSIRMRSLTRLQLAQLIKREQDAHDHTKALSIQESLNKHEQEMEKWRVEQARLAFEREQYFLEAQRGVLRVPSGQRVIVRDAEQGYLHFTPLQAIAETSTATKTDGQGTEVSAPFVRPIAPSFPEMAHLITVKRMPLCYTTNGPEFGTVDDLLSMAITGKPGRGKTTALMYYVVMLLKCGAQVFIFDPHGAMGALALLNGQTLPGMPATASVTYLDRKEEILASVSVLQVKLSERDQEYREHLRQHPDIPYRKYPLLILADELPVLAGYDETVIDRYKAINKQRVKDGEEPFEVPTLAMIFRRFVLEARKWRCFFIGSSQVIDAEILPTKITDSLNSRIVFFSSDRKARMTGLENDAIKTMLPLIRRAGSGCMIFDCARWDSPVIGAIPHITVEDMLTFLGVGVVPEGGTNSPLPGAQATNGMNDSLSWSHPAENAPRGQGGFQESRPNTGPLQTSVQTLVQEPEKPVPHTSRSSPEHKPVLGPDDRCFTAEQEQEFLRRYRKQPGQAVKVYLRQMNNGEGLSNRYAKHASWLLEHYGLK